MSKVSENFYREDKNFLHNIVHNTDFSQYNVSTPQEKILFAAQQLIDIYKKSKKKTRKNVLTVEKYLLPDPSPQANDRQASLDMIYQYPNNSEVQIGKDIVLKQLNAATTLAIIIEVATGNMLGDGSLVSDAVKTPALVFSMQLSYSRLEYTQHLYNIYSPWTTAKIYDKKKGKTKQDGTIADPNYAFITTTKRVLHTFFVNWRVPYCNLKSRDIQATKILPPREILEFLMTPRAIAYWFMDDGYGDKTNRVFNLCTDSFAKAEVELVVDILYSKYSIYCRCVSHIDRGNQHWRIYISSKGDGYDSFKNLVKPYILPCFMYKLPF